MSKDVIEKKMDWIISLLEGLPKKIAAEFEKSEILRKAQRLKELTSEMECLRKQNQIIVETQASNSYKFSPDLSDAINILEGIQKQEKMMTDNESHPKKKIVSDILEHPPSADQMAAFYNRDYNESILPKMKVQIVADNPEEQRIADQMAALYNHHYMEKSSINNESL